MVHINPFFVFAKGGRFFVATYTGTISAVSATTDPTSVDPAVTYTLEPPIDKVYCIYYYNFGSSDLDRIYFVLHAIGYPLPRPTQIAAYLRQSNLSGSIFLPGAKIEVRLWNVSDPPADVRYDLTLYYFEINRDYLAKILKG